MFSGVHCPVVWDTLGAGQKVPRSRSQWGRGPLAHVWLSLGEADVRGCMTSFSLTCKEWGFLYFHQAWTPCLVPGAHTLGPEPPRRVSASPSRTPRVPAWGRTQRSGGSGHSAVSVGAGARCRLTGGGRAGSLLRGCPPRLRSHFEPFSPVLVSPGRTSADPEGPRGTCRT